MIDEGESKRELIMDVIKQTISARLYFIEGMTKLFGHDVLNRLLEENIWLVLLCEGKNKTMEKELKNKNLEETSHILIPVKYYMM